MGAFAMPLLIGSQIAGTAMSVAGSIQQGKNAQKIANANAELLRKQAIDEKVRAEEEARITAEKGRKILSAQRATWAGKGIMNNTDSPLVIAAKTQSDINKDIGFIMESSRRKQENIIAQASIEETSGAMAKRQSYWDAVGSGVGGFGRVGYNMYNAGYFGVKKPSNLSYAASKDYDWAGGF